MLHLLLNKIAIIVAASSAVIPGPGSGSAPALGRVSAQRYGHPRVPGLPLLPRHGALHPADHRPGAAAAGPHGHGPAVSAARLLVSTQALILGFQIDLFLFDFMGSTNRTGYSGLSNKLGHVAPFTPPPPESVSCSSRCLKGAGPGEQL